MILFSIFWDKLEVGVIIFGNDNGKFIRWELWNEDTMFFSVFVVGPSNWCQILQKMEILPATDLVVALQNLLTKMAKCLSIQVCSTTLKKPV